MTIWLSDMDNDYHRMNVVYDKWFPSGLPPCRGIKCLSVKRHSFQLNLLEIACVQAKLASPEWRVEVRAIASTQISKINSCGGE